MKTWKLGFFIRFVATLSVTTPPPPLSLPPPPELAVPDVPADVELHVLQAAQCVREEHGGRHRPSPQLQVRLPNGEHHERVLPQPQLQPDADRRTAGYQRIRHRHAPG